MRRASARAGYALPAVLGVVAVLSLVLLSAASALSALAGAARGALAGAEFERRALDAESRLRFAAATSRATPQALVPAGGEAAQPIRIDGRPYPAPGDAAGRVALQDEAGLVNLDASRPDALLRLFAQLGLSAAAAETLRDQLLDALDADDDRRPRGAEAADYARRGRPRPSPGGFNESAELAGVLDWTALLTPAQRRALAGWTTVDPASHAFNPLTAPPQALVAVLAMTPEAAARFVATRRDAPLGAAVQRGLPPGAADASPQAGGRLRFTFEDARLGLRYSSRLAGGGAGGDAPWRAFDAITTQDAAPRPESDHAAPDASAAPADR